MRYVATKQPRLILDLDGVLADFTKGSLHFHGKHIEPMDIRWDFFNEIGFEGRESDFWAPLKQSFWSGLSPLEDGMLLFDVLRHKYLETDFSICTAPPKINLAEAAAGKKDWVARHLGKIDTVFTDSKWRLATTNAILLDDNTENVNDFRLAGGMAVLIPRSWNVRREECREDGQFDILKVLSEIDTYMTHTKYLEVNHDA